MSFDARQFRDFVVRPALIELAEDAAVKVPYSKVAEELLMLTAAAESDFGRFLKQWGRGPGLGVYQIEPQTAAWLIQKYKLGGEVGRVVYDLKFATKVARMRYWVVPEALPRPGPSLIEAMAYYHKRYYNTYLGAARVTDTIEKYKNYVTDSVFN